MGRRFAGRWEVVANILPYCDEAEFYDNGFVKVAEYRNGELRTIGGYCPSGWQSYKHTWKNKCSRHKAGAQTVEEVQRNAYLVCCAGSRGECWPTISKMSKKLGIAMSTVQNWMLGQFSASFTLDTYAHVTTSAQKEAAQTMGNVLSM